MKEATPAWPLPPSPFAGSDWFDPLEEAVRSQVRSFIEQLLEEELEGTLGRGRYERGASSNGRRHSGLKCLWIGGRVGSGSYAAASRFAWPFSSRSRRSRNSSRPLLCRPHSL